VHDTWPSFNLTALELVTTLVRGLFVAALLSTFGGCLFRNLIAPASLALLKRDEAGELDRNSLQIAWWSALLAGLLMLIWLVLESALMADAQTPGEAFAAIPSVIGSTSFGHVLSAQALALIATAAALKPDWRYSPLAGTAFAGIAVLLQAAHSHALAMHEGLLLVSQGLHLLTAGAWLGALLPLLTFIWKAPPNSSALAAQNFSPLGMACVLVLASTATFQGWLLTGGLSGLLGTAYGWVALFKLTLFALLLVLAALNYLRLVPALARSPAPRTRFSLVSSISLEMALGLLVVLAAGLLSSLEPGIHAHGIATQA
jgi:putative copper export protein